MSTIEAKGGVVRSALSRAGSGGEDHGLDVVGPQGSDGNGFTVAHRGIAAELDALGFEEADLGFQCVREFRRAELPAGCPSFS